MLAEVAAPKVRVSAPTGRAGCGDADLVPDRGRERPSRRNQSLGDCGVS